MSSTATPPSLPTPNPPPGPNASPGPDDETLAHRTRIGHLASELGLRVRDAQGHTIEAPARGFDHFSD